MEKAIGYIRVSTEEQTLVNQAAQIKKYCELNELELIDIIEEKAITGSTSIGKRPAGKTIQSFIDGGAKHIIASKLDRMFRSTVDALTQTEDWRQQQVGLHILDFCGFGSLNTLSPLGKMVFTMQAAFAEMELSQIRSRTKTAMQGKVSRGEFTGKLPFAHIKKGKYIEPHPERESAIKYINKLSEEGRSARFIAAAITEEFPFKCSHSTIAKILKGE